MAVYRLLCFAGLLVPATALATDALQTKSVPEHIAIFTSPPSRVPTRGMPDGPLLGNGDVGVVLAGPPEAQTFYLGKWRDFWSRSFIEILDKVIKQQWYAAQYIMARSFSNISASSMTVLLCLTACSISALEALRTFRLRSP